MYFVYSLLLTIGVIAFLPRILIGAFRHRKYVTGLRERLGRVPRIKSKSGQLIWLHCVSVGETEAARPLVAALRHRFPSHELVVSTTTLTGQALARKVFANQVAATFYYPIDWAWTVRRTLRALNPSAVLIMETELWPRLLRECRRRQIPVALVNGRISEKSFRGYSKLGSFIRRVVQDLRVALMQSEADADRLRRLGFPSEQIQVTGNLKFDSAEMRETEPLTSDFRARFGFEGSQSLIIAASTHEPEEQILVDSYRELLKSFPRRARLMIAPRHPERFDQVASLVRNSGLKLTRRSDAASANDRDCDVVLLDSIGELRAVFPLADLVFMGGSIANRGGHNMLEPAAAGACVVTGAHTQNFAYITRALLDNQALVQLPELPADDATAHLASTFRSLLENDERRRELAKNARAVCEQNRGATARTLELLTGILASNAHETSALNVSVPSALASG